MDNTEYIKSLEERIEKLEKFINGIKFENNDSISFSNCQIHGVGLKKCKNVSIDNVTANGFGFASLNAKIENSTIHNFANQSGKVKISNCNIQNSEEK